MNRGAFLFGLAAAPAAVVALGQDVDIPVELRGGRFFAIPRTAEGRTFACWLDTDGDGFVFDSAVEAFHLPVSTVGGRRRAALPRFGSPSIPPLSGSEGLVIFERGTQERADPILQGFDAQLGTSWFAGRAWRFDWPGGRVTMLAQPVRETRGAIAVSLDGNVPVVPLRAGAQTLPAFVDIAASIAYADGVEATTFITRALLERWHRSNPHWQFERNVSALPGCDRIVVPEMSIGGVRLTAVACTTRPKDDVFEGERVSIKLGANAYSDCAVTLDYRTRRLRLDKRKT